MSWTQEHIEILEKHREHWDTLTTAGYMRNLDEPVKKKLQQVFNEAVGPQRFTMWCGECVADMVRLLYTHYDVWLEQNGEVATVLDVPADTEQPHRRRRKRR